MLLVSVLGREGEALFDVLAVVVVGLRVYRRFNQLAELCGIEIIQIVDRHGRRSFRDVIAFRADRLALEVRVSFVVVVKSKGQVVRNELLAFFRVLAVQYRAVLGDRRRFAVYAVFLTLVVEVFVHSGIYARQAYEVLKLAVDRREGQYRPSQSVAVDAALTGVDAGRSQRQRLLKEILIGSVFKHRPSLLPVPLRRSR